MSWRSSKSTVSLLLLGSLAAGSTLAAASFFTPKSAQAQSVKSCQCTEYVANRFGLTRDFPNAGDWNDGYLQRNGFRQVGPQRGAIAVMERSFPGANTTYGHVGIVENVRPDGRIDLRGANQYVGGSLFTEAGCNNVRVTGFGTSVNGNRNVSFWVR
ncbi:CHAP domain-containing protein [Kamptonema formosum]|uniref:CHAP domain-containing protein n=1 Tax=Kamptonema formosum TaxID=331992 RepID=UPI00034BA26E|nr:CHAP domain-containing protein [Oscillatoria sp. PCC 10802]